MNYKNPRAPASSALFLAHARRDGVECRNGMGLLKSLTQRFDSLQKEVETLKEKEASQSVSEPEAESSQEANADRVSAPGPSRKAETGPSRKAERPRRRRARRQSRSRSSDRRKYHRGTRSNSSESTMSLRSRSCSPLETKTTGNHGKGKMTARRTDRQHPVKHSRSWADRMSDFEEEHSPVQ